MVLPDGNGRTGRLLICYEFLKNNIAMPIITKEEKINYINFIENQDVKGLAELLRELSEKEYQRINIFKEADLEKSINIETEEDLEL